MYVCLNNSKMKNWNITIVIVVVVVIGWTLGFYQVPTNKFQLFNPRVLGQILVLRKH